MFNKKKIIIFVVAILFSFVNFSSGQTLGGSGTISSLPQFIGTTTPYAITQSTANKPLLLTGLTTGECLTLAPSGIATTTDYSCGNVNSISAPSVVSLSEPGLVSLWHFDDSTGTTALDSKGSNNLTLTSSSWTTSGQLLGTAAATTYATGTNVISTTGPWTVMGWFYSSSVSTNSFSMFSLGSTPTDNIPSVSIAVGVDANDIVKERKVSLYAGGGYAPRSPIYIADNTWYHWAARFSGGNLELFINGVPAGTRTGISLASRPTMYFGAGAASQASTQRNDEAAYFNTALSDADIMRLAGGTSVFSKALSIGGMLAAKENISLQDAAGNFVFWVDAAKRQLTMYGDSNSGGQGPFTIKGTGATTFGVGLVIDATANGGKRWSLGAQGSSASSPAGFTLYNNTDNRYDFAILSSGHFNFARNFYSDIAQMAIIPTASNVVGEIVRGAASQTSDLQQYQNSAATILSKIDASGKQGIGMGATALTAFSHIRGVTTQEQWEYDATNYANLTIGSSGGATFDAVGSGAGFTFLDRLTSSSATLNNVGLLLKNTNTTATNGVPLVIASMAGGSQTNISMENYQNGSLVLRTGATTETGYGNIAMRIGTDTKVGIGDHTGGSPASQLSVKGDLGFPSVANGVPYVGLDYGSGEDALRFRANFGSTVLNTTYGVVKRTTGRFGINTTAPDAQLHVVKNTEQLRLGYDASTYSSLTVDSTGGLTFDAVGSGASYTFADKVINQSILRLKGYTVATLPSGTQGDTAYVTDALAPIFMGVVVGGGAVVTKVFYDGTNWITQ